MTEMKQCSYCGEMSETSGFEHRKCRSCVLKYAREYQRRPEVIARRRTANAKEKHRAYKRQYIKTDSYREKQRAYNNSERGKSVRRGIIERAKARRAAAPCSPETIAFRLRNRITVSLIRSLRSGRGGGWLKHVDYTLAELREHLELQFLRGMSWENMGDWHIDHIIPVSSFDLSDAAQVARCWSLPNLRPLWAQQNRKKHARVETLL